MNKQVIASLKTECSASETMNEMEIALYGHGGHTAFISFSTADSAVNLRVHKRFAKKLASLINQGESNASN